MPLKWRVWTVNSLSASFASYVRSTPAAARSTCTARRRVWRTISPPKWKTLNMAPGMCSGSAQSRSVSPNAARGAVQRRISRKPGQSAAADGFPYCSPPNVILLTIITNRNLHNKSFSIASDTLCTIRTKNPSSFYTTRKDDFFDIYNFSAYALIHYSFFSLKFSVLS